MSYTHFASSFALASIACWLLTGLTIVASHRWRFGWDESHGVQKFHRHQVARLGGLSIFMTLFCALLASGYLGWLPRDFAVAAIVCMLPAFAAGLVEDLTRKVGVVLRLAMTMVAAGLAFWLLDARLVRFDIVFLDEWLVALPLLSLVVTMIAAGGVAHSVNIIDGYNGLSGSFALAAFCSMGLIAASSDDVLLMELSVLCAGATAGFLWWNFPLGRIFLGDAGAYLIGLMLALIAVLLVRRNPEISAWAPLLVMIYPVWETLFSMLRRARHGWRQVMKPDALHLHHLINRRLVRLFADSEDPRQVQLQNSVTTGYLFVLIMLSMLPAVLWPGNVLLLVTAALLFVATYGLAYRRIVYFRVPVWMVARPPVPRTS